LSEIHEHEEQQKDMSEVNVFLQIKKFLLFYDGLCNGCRQYASIIP